MQSHAALVAADQASLEQALRQALTPALNTLARHYPTAMTPTLQALETRRLTALLLRWLDIERQRGPFTVVATEQELLWALPGLQLHLRLDRIDRAADGSTAIVDYKTGKGTAMRWEDERPAAPQLLLYQLAVDAGGRFPETAALLYARINVEEPRYDGIAADDSVIPGLAFNQQKSVTRQNWPELKQHWQQVIGLLADEFLQGYAAVQPARRDSCTYCHLASLCRITELRDTPAEDAA
jgi:RecB family exonuclease